MSLENWQSRAIDIPCCRHLLAITTYGSNDCAEKCLQMIEYKPGKVLKSVQDIVDNTNLSFLCHNDDNTTLSTLYGSKGACTGNKMFLIPQNGRTIISSTSMFNTYFLILFHPVLYPNGHCIALKKHHSHYDLLDPVCNYVGALSMDQTLQMLNSATTVLFQ